MATNSIELKSIHDLIGMNFYIPNYQRGYRWTKQQVEDLLNDVNEFEQKDNNWYCLQPLVVKSSDNIQAIENISKLFQNGNMPDSIELIKKEIQETWEVIDGQQRLTTIYIILEVLNNAEHYSIKYQTREEFLNNKGNKEPENNIDLYHINQAREVVVEWLKPREGIKELFREKLLHNVKFIWYQTSENNPIKVFTRLNIGKIPLTNSELIKALFLNRSNFSKDTADSSKIRLQQQEIASQWDDIESTLQNEEFWLFIHGLGYSKPTRIDFIFDLICEQKSFGDFGSNDADDYKTFRYFYEYFKSRKNASDLQEIWKSVKKIFKTFEEWYNDLELYHYVGYLIEQKEKLSELYREWNSLGMTKERFRGELKLRIQKKLENCSNLNKQYEKVGFPAKTVCRPLLLLHNIQAIINQNINYKGQDVYKLGVFYKFPFHLFKLENWDVEHIDSNTENDLTDRDSQIEYLLNIYSAVEAEGQEKIEQFINNPNDEKQDFDELKNLVPVSINNSLSEDEKNQVWNFALLDSSTNRSYGNSIFAAKRRIIIGKDKGKLIAIPKLGRKDKKTIFVCAEDKDAKTSFIPPCTKYVFLKYYSGVSASPNYWDKNDAESYKRDIYETLKSFGVTL